jgi:hypothetical protein
MNEKMKETELAVLLQVSEPESATIYVANKLAVSNHVSMYVLIRRHLA